jgi:hypothetical protein
MVNMFPLFGAPAYDKNCKNEDGGDRYYIHPYRYGIFASVYIYFRGRA